MNHKLTEFYLHEKANIDGIWLEEVWCWTNDEWDFEHSFIQWLFPLKNESAFNADAPLLDDETIKLWHCHPLLQDNLRTSYERWLEFCGVRRLESGLEIVNLKNHVWPDFNHNWLRVTRVLNSLTLLGLGEDAEKFRAMLFKAHEDKKIDISENTMSFWKGN